MLARPLSRVIVGASASADGALVVGTAGGPGPVSRVTTTTTTTPTASTAAMMAASRRVLGFMGAPSLPAGGGHAVVHRPVGTVEGGGPAPVPEGEFEDPEMLVVAVPAALPGGVGERQDRPAPGADHDLPDTAAERGRVAVPGHGGETRIGMLVACQHQVGVDVVEGVPEVPQAGVIGEVAAPPLVVPVGQDAAAAGVGLEVLLEPPHLLGRGIAGGAGGGGGI